MFRFVFILVFSILVFNSSALGSNKIVFNILKEEKSYKKILKKLDVIEKNLERNKDELTSSTIALEKFESKALELDEKKGKIEQDIVNLVAKKYSLTVAVKQQNKITEKIAVSKELYKTILKNAKDEIGKLNAIYSDLNSKITFNKNKTEEIKEFLANEENKRTKYLAQKKSQQILLEKLRKKRDEEARLAREEAKRNKKTSKKLKNFKKGSPLRSYRVVKKFGTYFDKKRNLELFNESVTLRSKIKNANVYNIRDGRVVYVKYKSNVLGNVVIVKHKNDIYTIYSYLDKISRNLKSGRNIKKGQVVGKVKRTLQFKATKNTKYIDPMKLIK